MDRPKKYESTCRLCGGTGKTVSGEWLRWKRLKAGKSLREMRGLGGASAHMHSDVERGKLHCPAHLIKLYEALA